MVTTGFIRVRRRKLKPKFRWYTPSRGRYAGISRKIQIPGTVESVSHDLVRAVRINGDPRHKFVLGLGSLKNTDRGFADFWERNFRRVSRHGLSKKERHAIALEMIRKGVRLPTIAECKHLKSIKFPSGNPYAPQIDEVIALVRRGTH